MTRKEFLIEFLGALGAVDILWQQEKDDLIFGTVIYDKDDPEETQDFCWHITESNLPDESVYNLAALLKRENLLNIDKIKISKDNLHALYNKAFIASLTSDQFSNVLNSLKTIEVPMVDDGNETDIYFIHE